MKNAFFVQGVFLLLTRCVFNTQIRRAWLLSCRRGFYRLVKIRRKVRFFIFFFSFTNFFFHLFIHSVDVCFRVIQILARLQLYLELLKLDGVYLKQWYQPGEILYKICALCSSYGYDNYLSLINREKILIKHILLFNFENKKAILLCLNS